MTAPPRSPEPLTPLWQVTARPDTPRSALVGDLRADIAIVGAGYAGLSTAIHAAEAGSDVVVIDAAEIGEGGSGLNGGQVNPGIKYDPDEIEELLGPERGPPLVDFVGGTAAFTFNLIERLGLRCGVVRGGFVQPAHAEAALGALAKRCAQWQRRGAPARLLDAPEMARLLGTRRYHGGWVDERGGTLHPLDFARGLADTAALAGARLFVRSAVERIERRGSGWRLTTATGSVTADRVALLTNAYADGVWPRLNESFVPVHSFQIATEPLPGSIAASTPPHGYGVSDTRRMLLYFRRDAQDRLLIGGRGTLFEPVSTRGFRSLETALRRLFPQIGDVPVERRWYGRVAITPDSFPIVHRAGPNLLALTGCNGRGVALFTALGAPLARSLRSGRDQDLPFPVAQRLATIPFHRLHRLYVGAASAYFRIRDWAA